MLPVAILAGGLAKRLRPITETIPKALVEVVGRPFIEWQLDYLYSQGVTHIVLCLGYLGEQVENLIGNGQRFGLKVDYSYDGERLLGTGGAIKKALPLLGDAFFVFYGDSYLPIGFVDVEKCFLAHDQPALMTVLKNGDRWDRSNVLFSEGKLIEYNKHAPSENMAYIDYGLGVLSADMLLDYPEDQAFDLAELYHRLSLDGRLAGYEVFERFYEIGSLEGLKETEEYLQRH
ncbi:MAG: nucleotidyltransferase family protein [Methylococcales bacterium]